MSDKQENRRDPTQRRPQRQSAPQPQAEESAAVERPSPLQDLQQQVGNAHIARMMAAADHRLDDLQEVSLAGGTLSNQLASRIYQRLGHGTPLDGSNQTRWEHAFGATLDDVRLHRDTAADQLSRSLGARAFTLGTDIFFRGDAGPQDSGLLAHEIAHVVQQRSMKRGGPLSVGSAEDPAERQAEGAAHHALRPASKRPTFRREPAGLQRDYDPAATLREFARLGEEDQREQMAEQPPPAMQVNNVSDASSARRRLSEIEGYRPQMLEGGRTGTISGGQISANEQAIARLSDYLVTIGEQGRTLSTFQQHVHQVRLDYGRVAAQMLHLEVSGVVDPEQTAAHRAEQIVGAATGATSAESSAAGIQGDAATIRGQVQQAHDTLMAKGNDFSRAQRDANRAVHGLNSALSNLNAGIIPREQDPALAAQQRAIKGKVSRMQSRLSTGLQVLSALGGAAGMGTAATAAATDAFGQTVTGLGQQALSGLSPDAIATAISEEWYREETNAIQTQIDQANAQSREAAITVNVSQVREAQTALFSALQTLEEKLAEYQQARDTLRLALENLGAAADRPGGGQGYTIIARLLGDVNVLAVQINTTIGLGQTEEHAAAQATEAREAVEGRRNEETGLREGALIYYRPYQSLGRASTFSSISVVYRASPQRIYFIPPSRLGSAYGGAGAVNPVVRQTIEELQEMRDIVQGMRGVLSSSLGLAMQRF